VLDWSKSIGFVGKVWPYKEKYPEKHVRKYYEPMKSEIFRLSEKKDEVQISKG
jgi:hypothetical protein